MQISSDSEDSQDSKKKLSDKNLCDGQESPQKSKTTPSALQVPTKTDEKDVAALDKKEILESAQGESLKYTVLYWFCLWEWTLHQFCQLAVEQFQIFHLWSLSGLVCEKMEGSQEGNTVMTEDTSDWDESTIITYLIGQFNL